MNDTDDGSARVIALWSAPRARSTAFFRSMVERGDLTALHEPFCNLVDFGETTVEGEPVHSTAELIAAVRRIAPRQRVFLKDTTDHRYPEVLADTAFLGEARHTFLIRRPEEVAASFYALKPDMTVRDIGLEHLHELYEAAAAAGQRPVVLDSDDLARDPAATIAAYCAEVGLEHRPETLNWRPGARSEWQRSDRWHTEVSRSSGFTPRATTYRVTVENDERLAAFAAHHRPFYEALLTRKLAVPLT